MAGEVELHADILHTRTGAALFWVELTFNVRSSEIYYGDCFAMAAEHSARSAYLIRMQLYQSAIPPVTFSMTLLLWISWYRRLDPATSEKGRRMNGRKNRGEALHLSLGIIASQDSPFPHFSSFLAVEIDAISNLKVNQRYTEKLQKTWWDG